MNFIIIKITTDMITLKGKRCVNFVRTSILASILSTFLNTANSQERVDCKIIKAILSYDLSSRTFKFNLHKDSPIVFVDLKGLLGNCNIEKQYERNVMINHDSLYKKRPKCQDILIYSLESHGHIYKISLEQTSTGAVGYIKLKQIGRTMVVKKFMIGYF